MPGQCPTLEAWDRYLRTGMSVGEQDSDSGLNQHLQECPACESVLARLVEEQSGDWDQLRVLLGRGDSLGQWSSPKHNEASFDPTRFLGSQENNRELPQIAGYELIREIGYGASARVFQAQQFSPPREVALKLLSGDFAADSRNWKRFQAEIEAIAKLSHENVVHVLEVGRNQDQVFFTMPLVHGGNLAGQLDGTPWVPTRAARFVRDLARGAGAAHQAGIVHRDIKPANVLLIKLDLDEIADRDRPSFVPQLTDFGIAKTNLGNTDLTRTGEIMGTPSYMAPEQILGHQSEIGPATDVYALGCILYELLTGRPPFRLATATETMFEAIHGEILSPFKFQSRLPRDLVVIAMKALRRHPSERYAHGDELAADLDRCIREQPILARPSSWWTRNRRWLKRHPTVTVAILITVAASSALLVLWGRFTWRLKQERDEVVAVAKLLELEKSQAVINFERAFEAIRQYLQAVRQSPQLGEESTAGLRRELISNGVSFYRDLLEGNRLTSNLPAARLTTERVLLEQARLFFELAKMSHQSEEFAEALTLFEQAEEISRRALGPELTPSTGGDAGLYGAVLLSKSKTLAEMGEFQLGLVSAGAGKDYFEKVAGLQLLKPDYETWYLAESWMRQGELQWLGGSTIEAANSLRRASQLAEQLPQIPDFQWTYAQTLLLQARTIDEGNPPGRIGLLNRALALADRICDQEPRSIRYRTLQANILHDQASLQARLEVSNTKESTPASTTYPLVARCLQVYQRLVELQPSSRTASDKLRAFQIEFGLSTELQPQSVKQLP